MRAVLIPLLRRRLCWLTDSGRILLLRLQPEHSASCEKANCPFAKVHVSVLSSNGVVTPSRWRALQGSGAIVAMPAGLFDYPTVAEGIGRKYCRNTAECLLRGFGLKPGNRYP